MTEMEKNFRDLEELFKLGMLDAEGYAFQKKQLEEMAREEAQAQAATGGTTPIQQEATSPSLEGAAPPPRPAATTGQSEDAEALFKQGNDAYKRGDFDEAFRCYSRAAEQGYAKSQNALGSLYQQGKGVPKDRAKANEWYRKAADQGYQSAQLSMGDAYFHGWGMPQDWEKAAEWYRKAADQGGHMAHMAQFRMGEAYFHGWGMPKDWEKAAEWYRKAAEQGNTLGPLAQKALAIILKT